MSLKQLDMKVVFSIILCLLGFESFSQEVRIGNQVVSTQDLMVTKFNNGDPIPIVKSFEESNSYALKGKPACMKVGNSIWYNWYAVNDSRGIAPSGWHVPNVHELSVLIQVCRQNIRWVAEKDNRTILPGTPTRLIKNEPEFNWWAKGENREFNESSVSRLKCPTSMGPLSIEIAKKSNFYPVRVFADYPNQIMAREYFLKKQTFEIITGNNQWKVVLTSENCDTDDNEESQCNGKATLIVTNISDSLDSYKIELDQIYFLKKDGAIVSNLGVRFEDFNFDGKLDFGIGFTENPFEYTPKVFFLDKNKKRAIFNEEFNKLFQLGESSFFDLETGHFGGMTTMANYYENIEYHLCPLDSLSKYEDYQFPSELADYKINYPNVFLIDYFLISENNLVRFKSSIHSYEKFTLDDWMYGEFYSTVGSDPYTIESIENGVSIEVQKIDSSTYYNAAQNIQENPFINDLEDEDYNPELIYLKKFGDGVKRKGDKLVFKTENGRQLEFNNSDSPYSTIYYGFTEDQKSWIVRQYGAFDAYEQLIIDRKTGTIDSSMLSFPRFSPNGLYCVEGNYFAMENLGVLNLYTLINGNWFPLVDYTFEDLEFGFAPLDLFWVDDKTIFVKQLKHKSNIERDVYFEYAKFTFHFR